MLNKLTKRFSKILFLITFSFLNSCASIVTGSNQVITIETPNCPGATCRLTNNDGTYFINSTPSTISINKSRSDLMVSCYKDRESNSRLTSASSSIEGMAFGNILIGGIIGGGVDMVTGAAYNYPNFILHPLDCRNEDAERKNSSEDLERSRKIKELEKAIEELKNK